MRHRPIGSPSSIFLCLLFITIQIDISESFCWNKMQSISRASHRSLSKIAFRYCQVESSHSPIYRWSQSTRLFGSKSGVPGNPLGTIEIYNDQEDIKNIDEDSLRETIRKISSILGYETYDVTLLLVEDEEMQETNLESRGVNTPTDILSFPFHDHKKPGLLVEPEFDIPDYYTLGDMMVDIPYVMRRCQEDEEEENLSDNDEQERGVSGAMAKVYDPEKRVHMLLVHGMLHLVGHDHEEDDEYEEMVEREEEVLRELGYRE